jgi:electron transfer flavoprotein beta subunit
MRLLVCVKQVGSLDEDFELRPGAAQVDPDSVEWSLNEWDAFAIEAAVRMAEADRGEVVAASVGGEEAAQALLDALARGADRAIRVDEPELQRLHDPLATARALALVAERESVDVTLCGVQSSDSPHGATGVALAGYLGVAHVAVVRAIQAEGASLVLERELEGGLAERLRVPLPAVLTVQTGINQPRYASFRAVKKAKEKPLETLSLQDLGLDQEDVPRGAELLELSTPPSGGGAEMIDGDAEEIAARIAEVVRRRLGTEVAS